MTFGDFLTFRFLTSEFFKFFGFFSNTLALYFTVYVSSPLNKFVHRYFDYNVSGEKLFFPVQQMLECFIVYGSDSVFLFLSSHFGFFMY